MITSQRKMQGLLDGEIERRFAFLPLIDFQEVDGVVVVELTDETREKLDEIRRKKQSSLVVVEKGKEE